MSLRAGDILRSRGRWVGGKSLVSPIVIILVKGRDDSDKIIEGRADTYVA